MAKLPTDPSSFTYYYVSTGKTYKLYAHVENSQDKNILSSITYTTQCGGTCNYGISSQNTTP
jgi:hypothetical protein